LVSYSPTITMMHGPIYIKLLRLLCEFFTSFCEGTQIYFFSVERDAADLQLKIFLTCFLSMSCNSSNYFTVISEMDNIYCALTLTNCFVSSLTLTCTFKINCRVNSQLHIFFSHIKSEKMCKSSSLQYICRHEYIISNFLHWLDDFFLHVF